MYPSASEASYCASGGRGNLTWIDPQNDLVAVLRWIDPAARDGFNAAGHGGDQGVTARSHSRGNEPAQGERSITIGRSFRALSRAFRVSSRGRPSGR